MTAAWTVPEYDKFVDAIRRNDLTVVSDLILKNGKVVGYDNSSKHASPLLVALDWRGNEDAIPPENAALIQELINAGADVNVRNITGETPLIISAWTRKYDTVVLLLAAQAHVNASNHEGYTSLIAAAQYGYNDIVAVLLSKGADVNMQTEEGLAALMKAASGGHTKTIRILLKHGADINLVTRHGDTAISLAREARHYKLARLLF